MRVLVVAAHPDDEVLGCGGTVSRLTARGIPVTACILVGQAGARAGRPSVDQLHGDLLNAQRVLATEQPILGDFPNIELNTVPHLELVRFIERAVVATEADVVFTHHPADINDDHGQTSRACQAAARLFQRSPDSVPPLRALYFMEVPSSTDWSLAAAADRFVPTAFFEIGEEGMDAKLRALEAYRGVMRAYPHPRSREAITALARLRGGQSRMQFAEAFEAAYIDASATLPGSSKDQG